jgi:putative flippase GtrA
LTRFISSEFVRYVIVGGANTVITYLAYLALLPVMSYPLAYSLTYAAGIVIAYVLNARFVFRQPLRWRSALSFPLVYVMQYLAGIALLAVLVETLHVGADIAPALVIAITVPLTFVLSRLIIKGRAQKQTAGS